MRNVTDVRRKCTNLRTCAATHRSYGCLSVIIRPPEITMDLPDVNSFYPKCLASSECLVSIFQEVQHQKARWKRTTEVYVHMIRAQYVQSIALCFNTCAWVVLAWHTGQQWLNYSLFSAYKRNYPDSPGRGWYAKMLNLEKGQAVGLTDSNKSVFP